jgi:hypothetical protein
MLEGVGVGVGGWTKTKNISKIESYRGANKSLARPERKQATARVDFEFQKSY